MTPYLRVGVITKPHGIRGEVRVYPTTESPERFKDFETLFLMRPGSGETIGKLRVESAKKVKNMAVIKLSGVESAEDAESLRGMELYIPREEGVALSDGEYYIGDIIGIKVISDEGENIGVVRDVLETGANDVYVVGREGMKDLLIPAIEECVRDVDIDSNIMTVHIMDGLWDL